MIEYSKRLGCSAPHILPSRPPVSGGPEPDIDGSRNIYEGRGVLPGFLSRCAAHPSSLLLPPKPQAWCHRYPSFLTTFQIIMFFKPTLISIILGALCVNALSVPVAREPAPEPECESPRLFPAISHRDLTPGFLQMPEFPTTYSRVRPGPRFKNLTPESFRSCWLLPRSSPLVGSRVSDMKVSKPLSTSTSPNAKSWTTWFCVRSRTGPSGQNPSVTRHPHANPRASDVHPGPHPVVARPVR